jgi:hypothetical protein
MEQKKPNQEGSRKYGGSSSFTDKGEPSKAPRQDEDGKELIGSSLGDGESVDDAVDSVESTPKQVGGNRGGV